MLEILNQGLKTSSFLLLVVLVNWQLDMQILKCFIMLLSLCCVVLHSNATTTDHQPHKTSPNDQNFG